jgi:hypothetical protein
MNAVFWTGALLSDGALSSSRGETWAKASSADDRRRAPRGAPGAAADGGEAAAAGRLPVVFEACAGGGFMEARRPGAVSSWEGAARVGDSGLGVKCWGTSSVTWGRSFFGRTVDFSAGLAGGGCGLFMDQADRDGLVWPVSSSGSSPRRESSSRDGSNISILSFLPRFFLGGAAAGAAVFWGLAAF